MKLKVSVPKETAVQSAILRAISLHPRCWVVRPMEMKRPDGRTKHTVADQVFDALLTRATEFCSYDEPGLICWRQNTGVATGPGGRPTAFSIPGTPDICGIVVPYGTWFGLEVKRPGGKLNASQERFRSMMSRAGGLYFSLDDPAGTRGLIAEALERARSLAVRLSESAA